MFLERLLCVSAVFYHVAEFLAGGELYVVLGRPCRYLSGDEVVVFVWGAADFFEAAESSEVDSLAF